MCIRDRGKGKPQAVKYIIYIYIYLIHVPWEAILSKALPREYIAKSMPNQVNSLEVSTGGYLKYRRPSPIPKV